MARTKASVGAKVSSGKSSKARCSVAPASSSSTASGSDRTLKGHSGGNPVCPRDTPNWQKPITNFFINKDENPTKETNGEKNDTVAGSSKKNSKKNIILSDDEELNANEKPTNSVLDESLELEPLDGEDSHKIEEYYPKGNEEGAKKSKGKEIRRDSKRGREEDNIDHDAKKVKVD